VGSFKNLLKNHKTRKVQVKNTQRLPDLVEIQVYTNYGPWGSDGVKRGKTIFTCVYIGNIFKNLLLQN
jgi:hypothetical protein